MKRIGRKVIYGATVAGVVALVTGLAIGVISLAHQNQNATGSYVSYGGTVTGLTYTSTVAGKVPNPAPAASTGTALSPQVLASGANIFCATTCTANDRSMNITYTFSTSMAGAIQITVQVTASAGSGSTTLYLRQASVATSGTVVIVWDVGTSTSALTDVTVTIHQCSGPTCP